MMRKWVGEVLGAGFGPRLQARPHAAERHAAPDRLGGDAQLIVLIAVVTANCLAPATRAQTIDQKLWAVEPYGRVLAIARVQNTIYIGGAFNSVGPVTGQGVPVHAETGTPLVPYPRVSGTVSGRVEAVAGDGEGGWFIGGSFTSVGGMPRKYLAQIRSDGTVSPWAPDPDNTVKALCLSGDTLFVGGEFTAFDGTGRHRLAAVDVHSGNLTAWNPDADNRVVAIAADSNHVFIGGDFTSIGGEVRNGLAAVDRTTGSLATWNPQAEGGVRTLAIRGNEIYAGGTFTGIGGQSRKLLAVIDRLTAAVLPWDLPIERIPACDFCDGGPFVATLAASGGKIYVGGSFTHINGVARSSLAAIDLNTHTVASWDPQMEDPAAPRPYCYSLAVHGSRVYVGGSFTSLAGNGQAYAGAVDTTSGAATAWNPRPNQDVWALAFADGKVYLGGDFSSVWDWQPRHYLAAIDATTGALTDWDPGPDNMVDVLKISGNTVYVTGAFTSVGGQSRTGIAALDGVTGRATTWNPGVTGFTSKPVWDLVINRGTVYVGGWFSDIGGQPRYCLAAVDSVTGLATAWDPKVDDIVESLAMEGDTLIIGGWFSSVAGAAQPYLAAIGTDGLRLPWNPAVDDAVHALTLVDGEVYIAGFFQNVGGLPRKCLAAVDRISGAVTDWVADTEPPVICLEAAQGVVYAGGWFPAVGGEARAGLAALDARTGAVLAWDPNPNSTVWALQATDDGVYVGGGFDHIGGDPRPGLAAIGPARSSDGGGPTPLPGHTLALAQNAPNPARSATMIRFGLANAAEVALEIYDLSGRRVSTPLTGGPQSAGPHEIEVRTDGWPSGVYYYRAEAAGEWLTRKMVVVK